MGRWMKGQGQFKRQTHCFSPIIVHIGVDQRCCADDVTLVNTDDVESSAILPTMSTHVTSSGALDTTSRTVQQASTHIFSLIVVHVGVDQRCRAPDVESPAKLPKA